MSMLQTISKRWCERQKALAIKASKAEAACIEFMVGAAVGLDVAGHPEAQHVLNCVALVLLPAPFPLGIVSRWAECEAESARAA